MSEQKYPAYVHRLLNEAREFIRNEDYGQADAADSCYQVLALFPDHEEASALIHHAFSDPWLIRDNRKAIGRHIDEWDDRSWQARRRLALSFRFMSRWEGKYQQYVTGEGVWPDDVREMAEEGRDQLLQDYLLGQSQGSEMAWPIFQELIRRTHDPQTAMLSIGHLYADQGYFAESVDVLESLLAQFPGADDARRLWAEVRWWRDNQHRIPWIPPVTSSSGGRFQRMMARTDPDFAAGDDIGLAYMPPDSANLPSDFEIPAPLPAELVAKIEAVLGPLPLPKPGDSPVDWSYLDTLESGDIDASHFPEWAQYMLLEIDDPVQEEYLKQFLLSYLSNPPIADKGQEPEEGE